MSVEFKGISPYVYVGIRARDLPIGLVDNLKSLRRMYRHDDIANAIESVIGIGYEDLKKKSRRRSLVEGRKMYCYFIKNKLGWSLKQIGDSIGNRDHTTVIHNIKGFGDLYQTDDTFRDISDRVAEEIEQSCIIY